MRDDFEMRPGEIRRRRRRLFMKQTDLATKAGMSPGQISRIENDGHKPHPDNLKKIAAALQLDPNDLITWTDLPRDLPEDHDFRTEENRRKIKETEEDWDKADEELEEEDDAKRDSEEGG